MTPADVELIIRRIYGEGIHLHPTVYVLLLTASVIAGGLGAYIGAFLRRKGENLATKADFESILAQLREQTREVEHVKNEIAQAGWIHQRRWDLKRQLYWELLETLEEIKQKGRWLYGALTTPYTYPPVVNPQAPQLIDDFANHMQQRGTVEKLLALKGVAGVVLTGEAISALDYLNQNYNEVIDMVLHQQRTTNDWVEPAIQQLSRLVDETERAYSIVLSESQEDLLADVPRRTR